MSPIKTWPENERPREKILSKGGDALSDAELLALMMGSGPPGQDVVTWARDVLTESRGLRGLLSLQSRELQKIRGLGKARAALLLAIPEIIKRQLREDMIGKHAIKDPESVMQYLIATLRDQKKECFKVLFLDRGNRILDEADLFHGTVDQTAVHVREIIKAALERHATGIVLVHNHPSGRIEPSLEDRSMTSKIHGACAGIGISVLDHIIIGDNRYFSFREQHLI